MSARDEMLLSAISCGDVAAQLLAEKASVVHWRPSWCDYSLTVELEDVEVQLGWCPLEGWDGPSTTADTLAKMVIEERRRFDRLKRGLPL